MPMALKSYLNTLFSKTKKKGYKNSTISLSDCIFVDFFAWRHISLGK